MNKLSWCVHNRVTDNILLCAEGHWTKLFSPMKKSIGNVQTLTTFTDWIIRDYHFHIFHAAQFIGEAFEFIGLLKYIIICLEGGNQVEVDRKNKLLIE